MKHLKLFFALFAMLALGVGKAWGADSGITASDGVFVIDFYNSEKLTSTSGSNLTTSNYSGFVKVATGITKSDVVTTISTEGTVRYGMNGGLTVGTGSSNSSSVTFNIGSDYAVNKITVYATIYDSGRWLLNGKAADSGSLGRKNAEFSEVTQPLVWDNLNGATTLKFTKDDGSGSNQKRLTIYTIVCEYTTSGGGTEEPVYTVTVNQPAKGGTIEADKAEAKEGDIVKLTATPSTGYNFDTWTVTGASGDVSVTDNQFTMPAEEVTVTASFVEKTKHTISWSVNGATKTLTPANVYEGDALGTLPTLDPSDICTGKVFVGWTTEANKDYKHATDAPEFITKDTKPSANTTYYAVFATEGESAAEPEEVTWSYSFSSFSGTSVQYAEETHDLGGGVIIKIKGCHINTTNDDFRIYGSQQERYVISNKLPGAIKSMSFNVGYKSDNLLVYGSTDGSTWTEVGSIATTTAYADKSIDFGETNYTYFKLDVKGTNQLRLKKMSVTYMSAGGVTTTYSDYTTSCGATPTIYNVIIAGDIQNGTVTASPTSAAEGATITLTVTPADGYMLNTLAVADESSNPISVTDNKFTMPASNVTVSATFKEIPAATLTLSKNGETEDITGYKQGDKVELPSITSDCVKEFVGWSADANCASEPEYKAGDEYTLAATAQTLYAVYATASAGETLTITPSAVDNDAENDIHTFTIDAAGYSLTAKKNGGSTAPAYPSAKDVRIYAKGTLTLTAPKALNKIVFNLSEQGKKRLAPITASVGTIAPQASGDATVTWTGDATEVTFTIGDNAEFGSENTKAGQLCFGTMTVTTAGSYSDYSTTCSAALANPTFSLAAGKYTEAKSVTISAAEGTIYYTMDGTTPTASSTQYTSAIALNDCGEYTIKAIAISSDSQSDVVSATYTIKLPLTNSQAAPYTEAEAVAVYDGSCYDNQDVYVKGTVKTATFNSTYGNYTITLTNGFQFYRFLQAAETKFTEDIIVPGDVLVACGKLSKHQTTYQLAEGCYLVERIPYEGEKTDISNTEATAYTVDKAFELIADVKSDLTKEVYVKGLVAVAPTSNPTADGQMTYKISDNGENTGNVLTVYLGLNLNGEKFTNKNDVQQGDYVVVKGKLLDYNSTYELNKGNQLVQHVKAATIKIADITMEVGETKTIAATITPAAAETAVVYTIKENTDNAISLSGNTITADAVGTATITATIATAAEYMGKTVDFTVTVNAKSTKEKVVILAEYEGQWYAMKAQYVTGKTSHLAPLPVTYFDGKLYNVSEEDKALIEWERAIVDGKATFYNDGKYLTGKSDRTDLTLAATTCEWTISEDSYLIGSRTFLYNAENNWFRNFGTSNAGDKNYSDMPTVTAPVYATGDVVYTRTVTNGNYGTICLPYASSNYTGMELYEVSWLKEGTGLYLDQLTAGAQLVAGKPYIFRATSTEIEVTCTGDAVATPIAGENGLTGTFTDIAAGGVQGHYIIAQNKIWEANVQNTLPANRAYIDKNGVPTTEQAKLPGRRRVCMGENAATGLDNITNGENTTIKVIENGQLIIIRGGEKFNAQGQRL